jgi:hypothetical protein
MTFYFVTKGGKTMIINENYKIESDTLNITLYYRQKTKSGAEKWRELAYFSTPHNALNWLVNREVKGTGMKELETVCRKIDELTALINSLKGLPELRSPAPRITKDKTRENVRAQRVTA